MQAKYKYVELVRGGVTNRGSFHEVQTNLTLDYYGKNTECRECYHSVFMHSSDYVEYQNADGSKTGYNGSVGIEYLYFDIDHSDLSKAKRDINTLISRIANKENIRLYYSGCKGFHLIYVCPELEIFDDCDTINSLVKNACTLLADGIESFDNHIYDTTRIIRTPNSINGKTGLYKIPLHLDEISTLSIEEIQKLAVSQRDPNGLIFNHTRATRNQEITNLLVKAKEYNLNLKTKKTPEEIAEGIKNGFQSGERHVSFVSLAGLLHSRNISSSISSAILHTVNGNSTDPLSDQELNTIISSVGRYPVSALYIEPKEDELMSMSQASDKWYKLRRRVGKLDLGFKHLSEMIPYFDPGQVMLIAARAGIGKTSMGMQIANSIATNIDTLSLMVSLEMPALSIFSRAASMVKNKYEQVIDTSLETITNELLSTEELKRKTLDDWRKLIILDRSDMTLEMIETYYSLALNKYGCPIDCVFIDYGGLLSGATNYEKISEIARGIKGLAKRLDTRIVVASQLSRAAGDGRIEVTMDMLRDSGAWEEAADYILGMWNSCVKNRLHTRICKNRFDESGKKFDIINRGLFYDTVDFEEDKQKLTF